VASGRSTGGGQHAAGDSGQPARRAAVLSANHYRPATRTKRQPTADQRREQLALAADELIRLRTPWYARLRARIRGWWALGHGRCRRSPPRAGWPTSPAGRSRLRWIALSAPWWRLPSATASR